jgi:hypothetical protein
MEVQFFALNLEPLKFERLEPSRAVERFERLEQAARSDGTTRKGLDLRENVRFTAKSCG